VVGNASIRVKVLLFKLEYLILLVLVVFLSLSIRALIRLGQTMIQSDLRAPAILPSRPLMCIS
jgi:hypothetical protein